MHRRTLLAGIGASIAASTAGCLGMLGEDEDRTYAFRVMNHADEAVTVQVSIGQNHDTYHTQEAVELEADLAGDPIEFDGIPGVIGVTVGEDDAGPRWRFPWPADVSDEESADRADIHHDPTSDQPIEVVAG